MIPLWRRLLLPSLTTSICLLILIALGTWQVHRLHWKEAILAEIDTAEHSPAVPISANPPPFEKVSATGRYLWDKAAWFGVEVRDSATGPVMGYFQIVPLQRVDASTVLVDRGWVPQGAGVKVSNPSGTVTVEGYVRQAESHSWFGAADDVQGRHFYALNAGDIASALGVSSPAPFVMVELGAAHGTYPEPATHLPRPLNNHLAYVFTWYGLAVALLLIFGTWVRGIVRGTEPAHRGIPG